MVECHSDYQQDVLIQGLKDHCVNGGIIIDLYLIYRLLNFTINHELLTIAKPT